MQLDALQNLVGYVLANEYTHYEESLEEREDPSDELPDHIYTKAITVQGIKFKAAMQDSSPIDDTVVVEGKELKKGNGESYGLNEIYSLIEQSKQIAGVKALLSYLDIFRSNPLVQSLELFGQEETGYDDNNNYTYFKLDNLFLRDKNSEEVNVFAVSDGDFYCVSEDLLSPSDPENCTQWNEDGVFWDDASDIGQLFKSGGVLRLTRDQVQPLLSKTVATSEILQLFNDNFSYN